MEIKLGKNGNSASFLQSITGLSRPLSLLPIVVINQNAEWHVCVTCMVYVQYTQTHTHTLTIFVHTTHTHTHTHTHFSIHWYLVNPYFLSQRLAQKAIITVGGTRRTDLSVWWFWVRTAENFSESKIVSPKTRERAKKGFMLIFTSLLSKTNILENIIKLCLFVWR